VEFSDSSEYGRISAWGYGEVIESTFEKTPVGSLVYGYLPIGTLPVDLQLKSTCVESQVVEMSAHRQHLMDGYNRYIVYPSSINSNQKGQMWDSLMQTPFETSFNDREPVHPLGIPVGPWTRDDADITGCCDCSRCLGKDRPIIRPSIATCTAIHPPAPQDNWPNFAVIQSIL
jgi:hypothetical protein